MSIDAAGEVALEDAPDFAVGLAFGAPPVDVGAGAGVVDHSDHRNDVQRSVQLPVSAAVESVSCGVARGCRDGIHPRESGERGFVGDSAGVRPRDESSRCCDRPDAGLVEQFGLVPQIGLA